MWRLRVLVSRLRSFFDRDAAARELQREIEAHLEALAQDFVRHGMSPEEAHYAARRQFGGVTQLQDYHREARGIPWLDHCAHDLSFGLRLLHKNLAFSLIVIGVLALGIGANTAVYSVAKGVVSHRFRFPRPTGWL